MTFESSCFKTLLVVLLLSELRKIGLVFFFERCYFIHDIFCIGYQY